MIEPNELELLMKIKEDHASKSAQLREMKKKSKSRISLSVIEEMLIIEKENKIDHRSYQGFEGIDDESYSRDLSRQESRIELLEALLNLNTRKCY